MPQVQSHRCSAWSCIAECCPSHVVRTCSCAGWKYIHGDVFRLPRHINLLTAILGSGIQIAVLTFSIFLLALLGTYSPTNRGAITASGIILYALTASVAGYVSGYYYKMFGGTQWVRNVLLTAALFSGPFVATFAVLNTIAIAYRSTQALPFGTIALMTFLWALVTFPLTVLGGILAKNRQVCSLLCESVLAIVGAHIRLFGVWCRNTASNTCRHHCISAYLTLRAVHSLHNPCVLNVVCHSMCHSVCHAAVTAAATTLP